MESIFSIKNRYWLFLVLPLVLFLTKYYLYFILRQPVLEQEGLESNITFQSFFIYNYLLALILMFAFLFVLFLLFKALIFIWQDLDSRGLLKVLLISYNVYFIPEIIRIIYFTFFHEDYHLGELKEFARYFYFESESSQAELKGDMLRIALSNINVMDLAFYLSVFFLSSYLFEEFPKKNIAIVVAIMALTHLSVKIGILLTLI